MVKLPEPPSVERLRQLGAPTYVLPAGTLLWRIYFRGRRHPTRWDQFRTYGPVATGRFDHHEPPARDQQRAIFYGAIHQQTCLAEVFQQDRLIDRLAAQPWLVGFRITVDLQLLDLTAAWPTAAGASMAINSGPRPRAQRWSRAIHEAYPDVSGLYYPSSMNANQPAVAFYERARDAMPDLPVVHRPLADPSLFVPIRRSAIDLGYEMRPEAELLT